MRVQMTRDDLAMLASGFESQRCSPRRVQAAPTRAATTSGGAKLLAARSDASARDHLRRARPVPARPRDPRRRPRRRARPRAVALDVRSAPPPSSSQHLPGRRAGGFDLRRSASRVFLASTPPRQTVVAVRQTVGDVEFVTVDAGLVRSPCGRRTASTPVPRTDGSMSDDGPDCGDPGFPRSRGRTPDGPSWRTWFHRGDEPPATERTLGVGPRSAADHGSRWRTSSSLRTRSMLDAARTHTIDRTQFGRSVAFVPGGPRQAGRLARSRSRPPTPLPVRPPRTVASDVDPATAADRQVARRQGQRAWPGPRPAGARRHRVHDRPRVPSLAQADLVVDTVFGSASSIPTEIGSRARHPRRGAAAARVVPPRPPPRRRLVRQPGGTHPR